MKDEKREDLTEATTENLGCDGLINSSQQWLEVAKVMNTDVTVISPDETIFFTAGIMSDNNISCVIVMDNDNIAGILTVILKKCMQPK